jgi:predicted nucleic acid-binding protein
VGSIIDSSVLIAIDRGRLTWGPVLAEIGGEPGKMSAITASELLQGVEYASAEHRDKRAAFFAHVTTIISVVPFDLSIATIHAQVAAKLRAKGEPVGAHDLMIAATALALGYRVLTRDTRSFPRIPGLDVRMI